MYGNKTMKNHLFMITRLTWNKIGINIGDLFLFLGLGIWLSMKLKNDTLPPLPPKDAIYTLGHRNI